MPSDGLLQNGTTDSGIGYVTSRSNTKAKKDRKKSKKSSRSRNRLSHSNSSLSNSDMEFSMSDFSSGDTRASTTSASTNNRASVSPAFYSDDPSKDVFDYANGKYVRTPAPEEEHNALLQSSANADPNDPLAGMENFQDEFEDEMDEIEMSADKRANFVNLSEMEANAKGRRSRTRKCTSTICICLFLGVVVGAIVWLVTSNKGGGGKIPQAVPEASNLLKLWCNEQYDLGPGQSVTYPIQVPEDCKAACKKAECCWNPNGDYECTDETQQFCEGYKSDCSIMIPHSTSDAVAETETSSEMSVPPAPDTLKTSCVPSGTAFSASKACYESCSRADCCWNNTSTARCTTQSVHNCPKYKEYCSFFNDHPPTDTTLMDDDIDDDIADDDIDDDDTDDDDIDDDAENELEDTPFPYASPALATYCAISTMEQNGATQCQQQCAEAECCWKVGVVNCASSVPDNMCSDYTKHCAVLNNLDGLMSDNDDDALNDDDDVDDDDGLDDSGSVPTAPDGLAVYCDPSEMEEISLHICQDKCEPAACCWNDDADICDSSVPAETCQPYVQACAILNDLATYPGNDIVDSNPPIPVSENNNVPEPPSDFATRCDKDNIIGATNGGDVLISCERDCLAAPCCWHPNGITCGDDSHCPLYKEKCSIFDGLFQTNNGSSGTNGGSSSSSSSSSSPSVPPAPDDINDVCAPSNLSIRVNNGAGIVQCERQCLEASCCWKPDSGNDCTGNANCAAYMEPCSTNLVAALVALETGTSVAQAAGTQDTQTAQEIASACDDGQAVFVKSKCEAACRPGNCCYDDTAACGTQVDCGIYDPCDILFRRRNLRH